MATYSSVEISRRKPIGGVGMGGGDEKIEIARVTIPAAAAANDLFNLFYLPPHARVVGGFVKVADLDTSTNVTFIIGDTGVGTGIAADDDRYFASSTLGQTGGVNFTMAATGIDFYNSTTQKLLVQGKLGAGPTTTAGDIVVGLRYTVEEPQGDV